MSDALYDLLAPHFKADNSQSQAYTHPSPNDATTTSYLNRLMTLSLSALDTSEPQSLSQSTHSIQLSLQGLSQRSHEQIITSHNHLSNLRNTIPVLATSISTLRDQIPSLDSAALHFSETYNKSATTPNALLERRREALILSRNVDRLQDILDLPTLLSSAISSSSSLGASTVSTAYATALDLNSHIKRLALLRSESTLVKEVQGQADVAMQEMATSLVISLKGQGIKLAAAMRVISWLRRVAPDLDSTDIGGGPLGSLFLVCRLGNLRTMLGTLDPLKELADQETLRRVDGSGTSTSWAGGQQTERYLKRYIEIFREQSFAIISMFKSIFPSESTSQTQATQTPEDPLLPLPSAMSTFPHHLITMLQSTLQTYLPNIQDRSSRDSLLTQVLYCAGSLGRLGGDFAMMLATLRWSEEDGDNKEWMEVIKKHRVLAGKLESLVAG